MTRTPRALLVCGLVLGLSPAPIESAEVVVNAPGADAALRESLRAASLAASAVDEDVTDGQELLAAAQADYRRLVAALYEAGHFGGEVSIRVDGREAATMSVLRAVPVINRIELNVSPGPQFRFREAQVAPLPPGTVLNDDFAVGEVATTPAMRGAAEDGVDAWREVGHAKAAVTGQQITANHNENTVAARIALGPGPKLSFGRTLLTEGSARSTVRPERIVEIAGVPEGETFSPSDIANAERRLRRTGAFRSAVVEEAEEIGPNATLDTYIDVEDARPRRVGAGIEISNIEGLGLSAFWMHRNFLGGAERFRVDGEVNGIGGDTGGIDYKLTTSLTRPAFLHPDMDLRFGINLESKDEPSYTSDLFEATVGLQRFVTEDVTASLDFGIRASKSTDAFGTRDFRHVTLEGGLEWDKRKDELNPTKGFYADVTAMPFIGFSGSDSGVRVTGDLRGYTELGSDRFVLAGRVQVGSVSGPGLSRTPPEYLFFSGGGGTVRGQDYQSLGGTTVNGRTVGGQSFLGLSTELRARITDSIGVVGFVDYGMVSVEPTFQDGNWHGGAGIGARYYTPIGPVRLDVAVPTTGESGFGVYVGIGQTF